MGEIGHLKKLIFILALIISSCTSDDSDSDDDGFLVTIAAPNTSIGEPNGKSGFTLSLDIVNNTGVDVIVQFTVSGSATEGTDYQTIGTSATISDGSQQTTIEVVVIDDSEDEFDETIIVTVLASENIRLGPTTSVEFILSDDD